MAKSFLERLQAGEVLVADGATGTNHQHDGLKPGVPPEEWVFDEPAKVLELHRSFADAGADIILTNTFGGTSIRMRDSKYEGRAPELNRRAVELAHEATSHREGVLIAGSMGPTGSLFQPFGPLVEEQAVEAYAEQAAALTEGGVDFLLLETMFAMDEALAAIEGVKQGSDLPLVCSFSYDRGVYTMMGVKPKQVVEALRPLGLAAIGANCGMTLEFMEQVIREMVAEDSGLPIWAKPNAGLPKGGTILPEYDVGPEEMAQYAAAYVRAGAQIVGGCCGNTPAHVAAIAQIVKGGAEAGAGG